DHACSRRCGRTEKRSATKPATARRLRLLRIRRSGALRLILIARAREAGRHAHRPVTADRRHRAAWIASAEHRVAHRIEEATAALLLCGLGGFKFADAFIGLSQRFVLQ